ncbi:hypothetical protein NKW43_05770 [Gluconobacter albidus]|uniref:hypothetical protein n=1 Tax=Gluconobacter albidus TaxID=318683 RepID=UPI00209E71F8|nr:hypothetical protein [Gluconobacter albidus]MCP1273192.1 hypothetical protein [Gluconobacter albidus]
MGKKKEFLKDNKKEENDLLEETKYTRFFKNRLYEIAFYFEMQNAAFDAMLGVKPVHSKDMKKCAELRKRYLAMFHPDANINSDLDLDFTEVTKNIESYFKTLSGGKL